MPFWPGTAGTGPPGAIPVEPTPPGAIPPGPRPIPAGPMPSGAMPEGAGDTCVGYAWAARMISASGGGQNEVTVAVMAGPDEVIMAPRAASPGRCAGFFAMQA